MRYFDHPIAAKFKIEKRDPLVTAEVYDYINVEENVLKHNFHIFYNVKYTGVKEFSFTLPKNIAKQVPKSRVNDNAGLIKQILITEKDQNQTLYTINTQREILGSYKIEVTYEEKIGQIEKIKQIPIFELITQKTKREHGFLVFKKNNNFSMEFINWKGLETTDINDPNFAKGNKKGVLAVFKYPTHGFTMTMLLQKLLFEPVLNTVINRLHISTTLDKDFKTRNEAVISLVNNRKQMLEFEVPEGSKVTSVARLKRMPSRYRRLSASEINRNLEALTWSKTKEKRRFKVNIATNVQKNAPFVLIIKYDTTLDKGKMGYIGDFEMQAITFIDVPVTYFSWILGLPSEYQYKGFDSNLVRHFPMYYGMWNALYKVRRPRYRGVWSSLSYLTASIAYSIKPIIHYDKVDTSEIKQDAETGVIPIYPVEGRTFAFSRLNGGGNIKVSYIYNNWLYTIDFIIFLLTCLTVIVIPKLKFIKRLSFIFVLFAISLLLCYMNLFGYQDVYVSIFVGAFFSSIGLATITSFQFVAKKFATAEEPKVHTLYRAEKAEQEEKQETSTQAEKEKKE